MKIHIEFCEQWNYHPEFDRVSKILLQKKPSLDIIGNSIKPRTGSFEVKINDVLVFSKIKLNRFPNKNEILDWL